jgi:hypothetical protein
MKSMSKSTEQMADVARRTALTARNSLVDLGAQIAALANHVAGRREPDRLRLVLWIAGVAALAGGTVFLFAPPGRELRKWIGKLYSGAEDKIDARRPGWDAGDNMANEGGGSRPRSAEHPLDGAS